MRILFLLLLATISVNLFGQGMRCPQCPPSPVGHSGEVLGTDGTFLEWVNAGSVSGGWLITGNASTNPSTNFLGPTDVPTFKLRAGANVAGQIDSLATGNNGFGFGVFSSMTTGVDNTALGYSALSSNTEGEQNNAVGSNSLSANTTGNYNQAFGSNALMSNVSGSGNIGIGNAALFECLGDDNVAIGHSAVRNATTGDQNVGIGENALNTLQTGLRNTSIGYNSDIVTQDVQYGTALGAYARASSFQVALSDSCHEIYVGREMASQSGAGNVLTDLTGNGVFTSAPPSIAGAWSTDGNVSTDPTVNFIGTTDNASLIFKINNSPAGYISTSTRRSVAFGYAAGGDLSVITGDDNVSFGYQALTSIDTGSANVGVGTSSLQSLTGGDYNVGIGALAGSAISTGTNNICIGDQSGGGITTGSNNTVIGGLALGNTNLNNTIALGKNAEPTVSNEFAIGTQTRITFASATIMKIPLAAYDDDAAAGGAGLVAGEWYQTTGSGAAPLNAAGIVMIKQ